MADGIEVGDKLFGYPVVKVSDEHTLIQVEGVSIGFMPRQFRENVLTLLRALGVWIPQPVGA